MGKKQEHCISFYQLSQIWGTPYATTKKVTTEALRSLGCVTNSGAPGMYESEFNLFREKFRVVQTVSGRWTLKLRSQLYLPGFKSAA